MDNTLNQYRAFYRALVRFENEFPYRVVPNCPQSLTHVRKIHLIMEPDDEDFAQHRTERVIEKIYLVLQVTQRALSGLPPYVKPGHMWWLRAKSRSLGLYTTMVQMSLMGLRFDQTSDVESASGIGGLNFVDIETRRLIDHGLLQDLAQLVNSLS